MHGSTARLVANLDEDEAAVGTTPTDEFFEHFASEPSEVKNPENELSGLIANLVAEEPFDPVLRKRRWGG